MSLGVKLPEQVKGVNDGLEKYRVHNKVYFSVSREFSERRKERRHAKIG